MALQSWGHSQYWDGSTGGEPEPGEPGPPWQYPIWQSGGVVLPSLGGACQGAWEWTLALASLAWSCRHYSAEQLQTTERLLPRLGATVTVPEHLAIAERVLTVLQSPVYPLAQQAVRQTAIKPTMRDHHYWRAVGQTAKAWNWSENVYRRLDANETADRTLRAAGSTVTNMDRELAVELAYGALKALGR